MKNFKEKIGLIGLICLIGLIFTAFAFAGTAQMFKYGLRVAEETSAHGTPPSGYGAIYVVSKTLYFKDSDGTETNLLSTAATTAWDDFLSPDANKTHAFTTYTSLFTGTSTAADQWTFRGLGNFGDVSVVKIESLTGNPTDGTVLEVVAHDANVDPLVVSASTTANAFVVGQNTGVVTIAGVANGTDTLVLTAGDAKLTDGNITLTTGALKFGADPADTGTIRMSNAGSIQFEASPAGADVNALSVDASEVVQIGSSGASGVTVTPNATFTGNITAVDGTFSGNVSITGTFQQDSLAPASAAPTAITVDGAGAGGVTIGGTSTGDITLGGGATLVNLPAATDLTLAGGVISVTDTANSNLVSLTNNTMTTASALAVTANATTSGKVISVTADALNTGTMLYLDSDGIPAATYYLQFFDGAANDFLVGANGVTTITGSASTDVLTLTAGDLQITAGDIDVDLGIVTIDNTADEGNTIKRNNATGTAPVLEVEETHATGGQNVLFDTKNTTAAEYNLELTSSGATQLHVGANGAAGDVMLVDVTDAHTGQIIKIDAGPWLGTAGEGAGFEFTSDSAATAEAGTVIQVKLQGTAADAAAIDGKALYAEDNAGATAGSYLVKLDTKSNTALHISNEGAAADGIKIDVADSYTGQGLVADLGPWLGTSGEGFLQITSDNAATVPAGQFIRLRQLGTGQHAGAIGGSILYIEDDATAPAAGTSYAVNIDATNIEALHVDTGKVLVDETVTATGGISAGNAADTFIYHDTVECNNACIKGLRAAPKELIAAPGANKFIELVSAALILDYGSEVLTESADNMVIEYNTSGADLTAAIEATNFIDAGADTIQLVQPSAAVIVSAANSVNKAVQLFNTGDGEYAGNASNDTTMTIKVAYRIHADGL